MDLFEGKTLRSCKKVPLEGRTLRLRTKVPLLSPRQMHHCKCPLDLNEKYNNKDTPFVQSDDAMKFELEYKNRLKNESNKAQQRTTEGPLSSTPHLRDHVHVDTSALGATNVNSHDATVGAEEVHDSPCDNQNLQLDGDPKVNVSTQTILEPQSENNDFTEKDARYEISNQQPVSKVASTPMDLTMHSPVVTIRRLRQSTPLELEERYPIFSNLFTSFINSFLAREPHTEQSGESEACANKNQITTDAFRMVYEFEDELCDIDVKTLAFD